MDFGSTAMVGGEATECVEPRLRSINDVSENTKSVSPSLPFAHGGHLEVLGSVPLN